VRRNAINERCARHVDALFPSEDRRLRRRLHDGKRTQRSISGLVMCCANRATEPIEKSAMRLVIDRVTPTARWVMGHEFRERSCNGRRIVIGGDLGVACHILEPEIPEVSKL
jgi:hypothetical protein